MIKFLIKSTNELRLETKTDVDDFHREIEQQAADNGFTLSSWNETLKEKKQQGEIVEEYYIVKYTFSFNDPKEPERGSKNVEYEFYSAADLL